MSSAVGTHAPSPTRKPRAVFRIPDVRLRPALRLWQRNAAIYRRTYKLNILPNFFEPFFYLLAMGLGLGAYLSRIQGVRYMDFIAPGLVATAALFGTSFEVTFNAFVKMQFGKIYDAVMSTPLSIEDIGLGELLWGTTRATIYGVVFLAITVLFGVMHSWLAIFGPVAIFMIGLMFSVIGLAFTAIIPLIDYFTYYWTLFITPMFLFSGVFFPLDRMPDWVQAVAWFVPLHQGVELMRSLTLTGDWLQAAQSGAWILVVTAALFVLPLNLLHRRLVK
jgi:lipooligosaccharide transport system permease protein